MGIKLISQDFPFTNPQSLCMVIALSLKYLLIAPYFISQASSQNTCLLDSFSSVELLCTLFLCCCLLHPILDIAEPFSISFWKEIHFSIIAEFPKLSVYFTFRLISFFLLCLFQRHKTLTESMKIHCEQVGNKANYCLIHKHQISIIIS